MRLAVVATFLALLSFQTADAAHLAFVVASRDPAVSVVDMDSKQQIRSIPMLREPNHLVLSPDRKSLIVADDGANALFFLDPDNGAFQKRVVTSDPYQLQFSPNGRYLTIAALARGQIDILDGTTMALLHRVIARSMPSHMAYTPDSGTVFVSLQGTDGLIAISTTTGQVIWNVKVGPTPAGVLWDHGKLLVGIMGADYVAVVDPEDGHQIRRITTQAGAHNLFFSPDGKQIWVCNRVAGSISVVDRNNYDVIRTYRLPGGPDDLDFAPDGKVWVARRFAHSVAVLDPVTGDLQIIQVGLSPHGIWLNTHPHNG
jgi:DNA-binding beta-propeller fold protein YncE